MAEAKIRYLYDSDKTTIIYPWTKAEAVWVDVSNTTVTQALDGKQEKITAEGILKNTADGLVAAIADTDYITPSAVDAKITEAILTALSTAY